MVYVLIEAIIIVIMIKVKVIYPGDCVCNTINNVPPTCTILQFKEAVARINTVTAIPDHNQIRIVSRGHVYYDGDTIGQISFRDADQKLIVVYATGLPNHQYQDRPVDGMKILNEYQKTHLTPTTQNRMNQIKNILGSIIMNVFLYFIIYCLISYLACEKFDFSPINKEVEKLKFSNIALDKGLGLIFIVLFIFKLRKIFESNRIEFYVKGSMFRERFNRTMKRREKKAKKEFFKS